MVSCKVIDSFSLSRLSRCFKEQSAPWWSFAAPRGGRLLERVT